VILRRVDLGAVEPLPGRQVVWFLPDRLGVLNDSTVVVLPPLGVGAVAERCRCGAASGHHAKEETGCDMEAPTSSDRLY